MYIQNDVMMFKRRHLVLFTIKLQRLVPEYYVNPEVINKLTLKGASNYLARGYLLYLELTAEDFDL